MPGGEIKIAADGEVLMRGGNVFRGYFKDQQATDETLQDGWLLSGDVGVIEEGGFLRITDRKKDLIITAGGKNISPSNIEVALKRQPFVGQAVAIGDRRPFMSALLTIDAEQVKSLADQVGAEPDGEALATNEKVREIFQNGVDAVNADLSNVERIKKFTILPARPLGRRRRADADAEGQAQGRQREVRRPHRVALQVGLPDRGAGDGRLNG